jgi:hypothetical protein
VLIFSTPEANEHDASSGSPLQLTLIAFAKLEPAATFTGTAAVSPAATVTVLSPSVKPLEDWAGFTTTSSTPETLGAVQASPAYRATMLWLPTLSDEVLHAAVPAAVNVEELSTAPPSTNTTVPVGVLVPPATCAVKVTFSPAAAGSVFTFSIVIDAVSGATTPSSSSALVDPAEFAFPT